jgi:hypothetical protein
MSLSDTFELSGHIVVKTGRGIGYHESVDEEVVFIGVAFSDASAAQPASDVHKLDASVGMGSTLCKICEQRIRHQVSICLGTGSGGRIKVGLSCMVA